MAFAGAVIRSRRNGGSPVNGYRQDLAIGDAVAVDVPAAVGALNYRWRLIGRPEGSVAGGPGPEPIDLGTSASATFTVDDDSLYHRDGLYVVECVLNLGAPNETRLIAGLARLSGIVLPDGRPLRKLGALEDFAVDTADPLVAAGWAKQMDRWLEYLRAFTGGGGSVNGDWRVSEINTAATKLGLQTSQLSYYADDFDAGFTNSRWAVQFGSADTDNTGRAGGVWAVTNAVISRPFFVDGSFNRKCYVYWRGWDTSGVLNAYCGFADKANSGNPGFGVGNFSDFGIGGAASTHFGAALRTVSGSPTWGFINSGIAITTGMHDFRLYIDGSVVGVQVDAGSWVTQPITNYQLPFIGQLACQMFANSGVVGAFIDRGLWAVQQP